MDGIDQRTLQIETTVIALREHIMRYFKGTCIENMVDSGHIHLDDIHGNANFQYQRQELAIRRPTKLWLDNVPLLELYKTPNVVVYYDLAFKRSPEFRAVRTKLTKFFREYLRDVKMEVRYGTVYDTNDPNNR